MPFYISGSTSSPNKGDDSPLSRLELGIVRKHSPDTHLRRSEAQRDIRIVNGWQTIKEVNTTGGLRDDKPDPDRHRPDSCARGRRPGTGQLAAVTQADTAVPRPDDAIVSLGPVPVAQLADGRSQR